ncbi:MAG: cell division protein FtsQ/DivIB [Paracoccaceae bacterium]|nr:cell division protein FtsQ/DivIB [Paracoccaceae bacterium]MDG1739026.1 cell division protein FtsQ/DivIB [Paracoccaceae bacterium]MDG2257260.1 cell division protein FtsQ/DivIB [Paracoccaceae bacterium]
MSQMTGRIDPAPSRWAYRIERLWLTPMFRLFVRVGLPFVIVFAGTSIYFADESRRDMVVASYMEMKHSIQQRPEFMVKLMSIDGASDEVSEDIRKIMALDFPVSSWDLDLEGMRQRAMGLDAVADAKIQIRPGGILQFSVAQRQPAIVWRRGDGLEVLDPQGLRVGPLDARTDRSDLPLIAGEGADMAAVEARRLFAVAGPVVDRIRGLVRVGNRRWDVVLDGGQRIMLPAEGAVAALERVMARVQMQDLLARRIDVIDMRNPNRPTVRVAPEVMEEIQKTRAAISGGQN